MPDPSSGNATLLAITNDPSGSPGTFTTVGQISSMIKHGITRENVKIDVHGETIARHFTSPVMDHDALQLEILYIHTDTQHDKIRDFAYANTTFGIQITGPDGSSTNRMLFSGEATNFSIEHPTGANPVKATFTFQPNGAFRKDGTLQSP